MNGERADRRLAVALSAALVGAALAVLAAGCGMAAAPGRIFESVATQAVRPAATPAAAVSTPAPAVEFTGRLLLERRLKKGGRLESAGLYEIGSGGGAAEPVAGPRPAEPSAVSPDGRFAVLARTLQDRESGDARPLPMDDAHQDPAATVAAAFSPDGTHLAYAVRSKKDVPALFLLDLAAYEVRVVHEGACERYSAKRICTFLGDPVWAGDDALLYTVNDRDLPLYFESGSDNDPVLPSRMNLITRQGRTILTLARPEQAIPWNLRRAGDTIFFTRLADEGFWLDAGELAGGAFQPHALPYGVLVNDLSPDGRHALLPGQPWRLVEVRTGRETRLGTSANYPLTGFMGCLWSEVQPIVACVTYTSLLVVPLSDAPGGEILKWDPEAEVWELAAWRP